MQGKRFVLMMIGVLILFSILYLAGSAAVVKTKADVCQGYVSAADRARCSATATAGPPPNLEKYH